MGYEREMSARQKALDLVKKRDAIEAEMDAIVSSLTSEGGPGMTGNIVDGEGFPRADIDVHGVRTQRNRYAVLRTDHKAISAEIEKYLHIALAPPAGSEAQSQPFDSAAATASNSVPAATPSQITGRGQSASTSGSGGENSAPNERPSVPRRPAFALVDIVSEHSPAASAGLLVNDRIVSFGAVSLRSFATPQLAMAALPGLLREHENQSLDLTVERGSEEHAAIITLGLTPRRWSGAGLLGCHVVPCEVSQLDERYRPDIASAFMSRSAPSNV